jgi:hypothetical protein
MSRAGAEDVCDLVDERPGDRLQLVRTRCGTGTCSSRYAIRITHRAHIAGDTEAISGDVEIVQRGVEARRFRRAAVGGRFATRGDATG